MYVDIIILSALQDHPSYGYELKRQVEYFLVDTAIKDSQLYPALRRFEEQGAVSRTIERQLGRPDRHIYRLTERGHEVLQSMLREFPLDLARSEREFLTRVANFHLLDAPARLEVLTTRQAALRHILQRFEQWHAYVEDLDQPNLLYGKQVLAFQIQRLQQDLEWITVLAKKEQG